MGKICSSLRNWCYTRLCDDPPPPPPPPPAPVIPPPVPVIPPPPVPDDTRNRDLPTPVTVIRSPVPVIRPSVPVDTENPDLDALINYISYLLQQINAKKSSWPKAEYWPTSSGFQKLKEFLSEGINVCKDVIPSEASTVACGFLQGMGTAHLAMACLLVVANMLERFETVSQNQDECFLILKEMNNLARNIKLLRDRAQSREELEQIVREATTLIVEGSMMCGTQIESSKFARFFKTRVNKDELCKFKDQLDRMYLRIIYQIDILNRRKKPDLCRQYPEFAVGIEDSVNEVLRHFQRETAKKAIAIILHGPGGIGKSVLADAVFSRVNRKELKYSKVELFDKANSALRDTLELQKFILQDLRVEETREIRSQADGQAEIGRLLENVEAIIYIDHVLGADGLRCLLPTNLKNAKKVWLLLTARNQEDMCKVCRVCKVETITYQVQPLPDVQAMRLLKKELELEEPINSEQQITHDRLSDIVNRCGGIPQRLIRAAEIISCEDDKETAYLTVMEELPVIP